MIRCKLKPKTGYHYRKETGKGLVVYKPGDIMTVENIQELGGAKYKFLILDPIPEENPLQLDEPPVKLKMVHKGRGKFNIINVKTGLPVNEGLLNKEEAQTMLDAIDETIEDV